MPLTATFDSVNSRVQIVATGLPSVLGMPLYIERRVNGGEWVGVRGAYPGFESSGQISVSDYEFTPGQTNEYRIRTDFVYDSFSRTATNTWGFADSGQLWTHNGVGAAANWDVAAGVGTYVMGDATGSQAGQGLLAVNVQDADIRGIIKISQAPTGSFLYGQVRVRGGAGTPIVLRYLFTTGSSLDLQLFENGVLIATSTTVLSGIVNTDIQFRFQVIGKRYRAKVWLGAITAEPATWEITVAGTLNPVAGDVRIEGLRASGNTNVNPVLTWENFRVADLAETLTQYALLGGDPSILDTFTRTTANGWGSTDTGQAYTAVGGAVGDYSVATATGGSQVNTAVSVARQAYVASPSADMDIYIDVRNPVAATADTLIAGPIARYVDIGNFYQAVAEFTQAGNINLIILKRVATVQTVLVSQASAITTYAVGSFYRMRFRLQGNLLRAKIWLASASEPQAWGVEITDASFAAAGNVGARSIRSAANTNVNAELRFDNFNVANFATGVFETVTPVQDTVWLKFPLRPFLNRAITFCNWSDETVPARNHVFEVLGRRLPVATNDVRGSRRFDAVIKAVDSDEAEAIRYALSFGDTVLLQTPGPGVVCQITRRIYPEMAYFSLDDTVYSRVLDGVATMAIEQPMTEVAPPDPSLEYSNATWQGIVNAFATWAAVISFFPNWAAVMAYVSAPSDEIVG